MAAGTDNNSAAHSQKQPDGLDFTEPVHLQPDADAVLVSRRMEDGNDVLVYSGGLYLFQRLLDEDLPVEQALLELRAQNAVVFYSQAQLLEGGAMGENTSGVYLEGDVIAQIGYQKITTDRLYYDFKQQRALILDGVLQIYLPEKDIPIYVRAEKIRQLSRNHFAIEHLKISTDEFHQPHVWAGAKSARIVTDQTDGIRFELRDVTLNQGDVPIFWLPVVSGNSAVPEAAISKVHMSSSREHGFALETEWPLRKLLGAPEVEGIESTLYLDEFTKRGPAVGLDSDYSLQNAFGQFRSYLLQDDGKDRLSRFDARRDVEPEKNQRGRLRWQHRQYLPDDWQMTTEISHTSDRDFLESWEEREFDTEKEQETLLYFKRQRDNWALDFLNKWRLNDHQTTQTEIPAGGFHLAGQDLFETLTYYQDTRVARMRERADEEDVPGFGNTYEPSLLPGMVDHDTFAFGTSRHELVLPVHSGPWHISPTVIGTAIFDDSGINTSVENSAFQGAAGLRLSTQWWHVDKTVSSRIWNLDQLRHIVIPEVSAFWVDSNIEGSKEQNIVNMALRQRWQTKRGVPGQKHSVDFLRLNSSLTLVSNDVDDAPLPNRFFFSSPEPQFGKAGWVNPDFVNLGLARREMINQTLSDHADLEWDWLISDTTVISGDLQYNLQDTILKQINTMVAIQRTERLGFFISDRYFENGNIEEDVIKDPPNDPIHRFVPVNGHYITGGTTYRLNPKYTMALAHQFDIEQGNTSNTQAVIIRKSPRWYTAVSVDFDANRDDFSISISIWPEGLDKVALGSRRYGRLTR